MDLLNGFGQNLASESLNFNNVIGEVGYPVGWSLNPGVKGYADADFTVTKEEKYYGESSLKIVNRSTADENKYGYLYQTFTINPNTTYRFGGRYLSNSNNDVEIFFGYGNSVATISQTSSRWKRFSTIYTTTADEAGMIVIGILVKDICEGLYLDDFYLFEGNSTVNLLDNPDFEKNFISNDGLDLGICEQSVYDFKDKLDKYNENNISVIMTPCLYTMRSLLSDYPEANDANLYYPHLPFNITHPRVIELAKLYFDTVLPIIKGCENLIGIQLTNEPSFSAAETKYYLPFYQQWLKGKYGANVQTLNEAYGTSYTDYLQIPMPTEITKTAVYNDYHEFNASRMTQYNVKLSEFIHDKAPDLWVMSKVMMYQSRFTGIGTNYEDMSAAFDVNGNDAWAYLNTNDTIVAKNLWYDLQTSIKTRPVFNLENHVILDNKSIDYSFNYADFLRTDMWQGALHGLSGNLTWLWGISDHIEDGIFRNTTMEYRLDCMLESAKTGYDINRLAKEISALANKKSDVALLYSYTTLVFDTYHEALLGDIYKELLACGAKPTFVTEEDFFELEKCDVLIVPYAINVPEKTLQLINRAIDSGKEIIIFGNESLCYNENNKAYESSLTENIKNNVRYANVNDYCGEIQRLCSQKQFGGIELETSNSKQLEISSARMNDRVIVNFCNYSYDTDITASMNYFGEAVGACKNLITGETCNGNELIIPALTPVMLEFNIPKANFEYTENSEAITASVEYFETEKERNAILYLAIYSSEGQLISVHSEDKSIALGNNPLTSSLSKALVLDNENVRAFLWEKESMSPLADSKIYVRSGK